MAKNEDGFFGKPVYVYSRSQALEDGLLVDVTHMAKEVGFKIPVVVTDTVWDEYITWGDEDNQKQTHQDQAGRLWDILWMLHLACKRNSDKEYITYHLYVIPRDGFSKKLCQIELKAVISGGDSNEPVITIMLPNED